MAKDITGRPPLQRRPSKDEIDILDHMLAGDPNGGDGRKPRGYIIGVMARKLNQAAGGPVSDTYRPARDWPAYDTVIRLAEDGFLDTAGLRRCAVFATPEQRKAAARAVRAAGRYVRPEPGRPTAESHFGMALDAVGKAMLRVLIGHPPMTQRLPHQLVLARAGTPANLWETNAKFDGLLATMSCFDIVSQTAGVPSNYYFTTQQLRRAIQGFHLGLIGPDDIPANLTARDPYGRTLGAGSAVRVASGLIDPSRMPVHYPTTRPKNLVGRVVRPVDVIVGVPWFLVHFGRGLKWIYSRDELRAITPSIPAWPTDCKLRATATEPSLPMISWRGPTDCFFRVERRLGGSGNGGKWRSLSVCRGTTYIDYSAQPGVVNIYRVRSVNIEGQSTPGCQVKYTPASAQPLHADKPPAGVGPPPPRAIWPRRRIVDVD